MNFDTKSILIVLISLILGAGIGFSVSQSIAVPQIEVQSDNNLDLKNIENLLSQIANNADGNQLIDTTSIETELKNIVSLLEESQNINSDSSTNNGNIELNIDLSTIETELKKLNGKLDTLNLNQERIAYYTCLDALTDGAADSGLRTPERRIQIYNMTCLTDGSSK